MSRFLGFALEAELKKYMGFGAEPKIVGVKGETFPLAGVWTEPKIYL